MTDRQVHGDEATGGVTEHHRTYNFQRFAKCSNVVGPLLECTGLDRRARGTSLAAQVDVNQLGVIPQRTKTRSEIAVIEAGSAVQRDQRWLFLQLSVPDFESGTLDVEIDLRSIHLNAHKALQQKGAIVALVSFVVASIVADDLIEADVSTRCRRSQAYQFALR